MASRTRAHSPEVRTSIKWTLGAVNLPSMTCQQLRASCVINNRAATPIVRRWPSSRSGREGPWEGRAAKPRKTASKVGKADLVRSRLTEKQNNDLQEGAETGIELQSLYSPVRIRAAPLIKEVPHVVAARIRTVGSSRGVENAFRDTGLGVDRRDDRGSAKATAGQSGRRL